MPLFVKLSWDEADPVTGTQSLAEVLGSAGMLSRNGIDLSAAHSDRVVDVAVVMMVVVTMSGDRLCEKLLDDAPLEAGVVIA
jgi:hypothetical protein